MTAALVTQYGAACDHAVIPATDAVRMIDPDLCWRITGTAARMAFTEPIRLMSITRCQSASVRLWIRPFGASTPALLMSTSSRPNRSTVRATTASTWATSVTSAMTVSIDVGASAMPSIVACSDCSLTSLRTRSVSGSLASS